MNIELLRKIAEIARQHPNFIRMSSWCKVYNEDRTDYEFAWSAEDFIAMTGGKTLEELLPIAQFCIGGLALFLSGEVSPTQSFEEQMCEVLGLGGAGLYAYLVHADWWQNILLRDKIDEAMEQQTPQGEIVADYIDWFIETFA